MNEESIFMEALQKQTPDERAAFLDQACASQPELRHSVELLLKAHEKAGHFLQGEPRATIDQPASERPGAVIGRYKLLQQIGEGGMGVVYMAEQEQPVRRRVALKIIKPGMDSRQIIARFEAERQALAMMDHINIARVLDAGATEAGRPYFVMELVNGVPITKYCDDNHLTPRERLELFVPVCQAIQHAHQKGIIHRDIKPSNVLVTLYDGKPVPKVIDFGVAKATEQKLTERTLFTQHGTMVGTLEYMSPEQAEISALGVDTRSDIYSLGVLLYELLTGSTPLSHKRLAQAAYGEVLRIIKEEEPPKPSTRVSDSGDALASISAQRKTEPAKLSNLMRGELDWIVMKTLEKDRNRRYETASGFAADVERYLHDKPVDACPPSASYRLRKFVRRNKGPVAAGVALAALLVLGTVGTSIGLAWALQAEGAASAAAAAEAQQRQDAERQRDRAQAAESLAKERLNEVTKEKARATSAEARAKEEAAVAKAVNDFLQNDMLAQAAPDKNARVKKVTVEEVLGRAASRIAGKFQKQPLIEAAIRQTIGDTYRALGNYAAAQPHLERALELRRHVLGEEHADTLDSMNSLAVLYRDQDHYAKAELLYVKTLEVSRHVLGEENLVTLAVMNNLGGLYQAQGQLAKAEPLFVKALEVQRHVLGEEHLNTLTSMHNLGSLYQAQGQYAKAEPLFVKTLEVECRVLGGEHPGTLTSMYHLASLYQAQGLDAKAEPLYVKTLEVRRRILGEEHPDTLRSMNNLAVLYWRIRKLDLAIPLFEAALKIRKAKLGPDHPDTLGTMANLGVNYTDAGRLKDAVPLLADAYGRIQALPPANQHPLNWVRGALADAFALAGQPEKGETLLREEVGLLKQSAGPDSPTYGGALAVLGQNLLRQKKWAEAEPILRGGLAIREKKEADVWTTFITKSALGGALLGQKKYAEAEPLLLAGYEGMKERAAKIVPAHKVFMTEALERLVRLYEAMGKKDKADEWRKKLEVEKGEPPGTPIS